MNLPDPTRIDRIALDTETTGLGYEDRPVGLSWALPDGSAGYVNWGHGKAEGKDVGPPSGPGARWMLDLLRSDAELIFHHALFDLRMLSYLSPDFRSAVQGIEGRRLHDTQFIAAIENENRKSMSLKALSGEFAEHEQKLGDETKLWQWLADQAFTHSNQATRKAQAKYISQAPASIVREYAEQDAIATLRTFEAMMDQGLLDDGRLTAVYDLERRLLPVSLRMHLEGTPVDLERARDFQDHLQEQLREAEEKWQELTGGVNVNSTPQLYDFFKSKEDDLGWADEERQARDDEGVSGTLQGVDALIRWTGKGNPSMAKDVLDGLPENQYVDTIKRMRKLDHYGGTFIQSYVLDLAQEDEDPRPNVGVLHPLFHQLRTGRYGTVSGRYSSSDPNAQNIPARDKDWAPVVRGLYMPREGCKWCSADYSQIEYRFLAHYADLMRRRQGGRSPLAEAYERDADTDFHQVAADMAGIERKPAKNVNFMAVYGGGVKKTAKMLDLPLSEARNFLDRYHARVPDVRMMYNACDRRASARDYVFTWYGRRRRFDTGPRGKTEYTYRALNALLQGSAADLLKVATLNLVESGIVDWDDVVLHLTVHDELNFSIRKERVDELEDAIRHGMERLDHMHPDGMRPGPTNRLTSGVPIRVDIDTEEDWGACNEYCHPELKNHKDVLRRLGSPAGIERKDLPPEDIPPGRGANERAEQNRKNREDA